MPAEQEDLHVEAMTDQAIDALGHLLRSQHHLVEQLRAAGWIADHARPRLLAEFDQIDTAITAVRRRLHVRTPDT